MPFEALTARPAPATQCSSSGDDRPYRVFVESMRDGAATLSASGLILYANPRLAELLSRSRDSIVGLPLARFTTHRPPGRAGADPGACRAQRYVRARAGRCGRIGDPGPGGSLAVRPERRPSHLSHVHRARRPQGSGARDRPSQPSPGGSRWPRCGRSSRSSLAEIPEARGARRARRRDRARLQQPAHRHPREHEPGARHAARRTRPSAPGWSRSSVAATRSAELARQMLAYSGKGQFVVRARRPRRASCVDQAELINAAISKKADVCARARARHPAIEADVTQLHQVDHEPDHQRVGGDRRRERHDHGRQRARRRRPGVPLRVRLRRGTFPTGDYAFFEVLDTGAGMDAETIEQDLRPVLHHEVHGPRARPRRGPGHRPRAIAARSKVLTEPGVGHVVQALVPGRDEAGVREPRGPSSAREPGCSGTVLVADDDEHGPRADDRDHARIPRLHVVPAADGDAGVARCSSERADEFAFVLLDLMMPGMSGEEVIDELDRIGATTPSSSRAATTPGAQPALRRAAASRPSSRSPTAGRSCAPLRSRSSRPRRPVPADELRAQGLARRRTLAAGVHSSESSSGFSSFLSASRATPPLREARTGASCPPRLPATRAAAIAQPRPAPSPPRARRDRRGLCPAPRGDRAAADGVGLRGRRPGGRRRGPAAQGRGAQARRGDHRRPDAPDPHRRGPARRPPDPRRAPRHRRAGALPVRRGGLRARAAVRVDREHRATCSRTASPTSGRSPTPCSG